jgi:hypothetical protein
MKTQKYYHCYLAQGNKRQISWLPEHFAREGKSLILKDCEGEWIVISVSDIPMEEEIAVANSREHLKHRDITDI